jgi:hypothetical protein
MSHSTKIMVFFFSSLIPHLSSLAHADGGAVLLSERRGPLLVTVFASPTPLRAGPVDFSVLVQDASSGEPVLQSKVKLCLRKPGTQALQLPATHEAATNKLLQAVQFELPDAGRWRLDVEVEGSGSAVVFSGELEAGPPLPRWRELWPWIGWPVCVIGLFGVRRLLARGKLDRWQRPPT